MSLSISPWASVDSVAYQGFGAADIALLLILRLSVSQIQIMCKSVCRQQLGSVLLSWAVMVGRILMGSHVHITLLPHI